MLQGRGVFDDVTPHCLLLPLCLNALEVAPLKSPPSFMYSDWGVCEHVCVHVCLYVGTHVHVCGRESNLRCCSS